MANPKRSESSGSESPIRVRYQDVRSEYERRSHLETYIRSNRFPLRPIVNMSLIVLITFQVCLVVSSHIYLRGSLIRSFLEIYARDEQYPQLFSGEAYYLTITNVSELRDNLVYTFDQMEALGNTSFLEIDISRARVRLSVEYLGSLQGTHRQTQFDIDPMEGITEPFNMHNVTSIQQFLVQVSYFRLSVSNLTVQSEGFFEKYVHEVSYSFEEGLQMEVGFEFKIDDVTGISDGVTIDRPQANYILVIRLFYLVVLTLAVTSLYLNYRYIRRTMKVIFRELAAETARREAASSQHSEEQIRQSLERAAEQQRELQGESLVGEEDMAEINESVLRWIRLNRLTLQKLSFRHYLYVVEFDIIFSVVSNVFTVVGSFYLFLGLEREVIVGVSCLASWMTIFKFLKQQKALVLMYELLKLSIVKVVFFFVEFLPVFLAYTLLGLCLFPKTLFFNSLAYTVTTLVSLMMGDSIQMITQALTQKYSALLAVLYIFSFVLMFMHAIHNTLTSLIKEAFILKKIDLISDLKAKNRHQDFIYLSETKCSADQGSAKDRLPVLLTESLKKDMRRIHYFRGTQFYLARVKKWLRLWEKLTFQEKWDVEENEQIVSDQLYIQELQRRQLQIRKCILCAPQRHNHESLMTDG